MSQEVITTKPQSLPIIKEEKETPRWLIALSILLPTAFATLATSATNVAITYISGYFGSTTDEANWVITIYMIANAILIPLTGWLERTMGRVWFLKVFITIFTLGSLLCAFAPSLNMLVLGRLIQGIGGGPMMPISQAILIACFPPNKRGQAMALFGLAVMVFSILGPTFGGYIVEIASWQWIYLINIPIGIISISLVHSNIKEIFKEKKREKTDFIGLFFLILWLLTMQIVLDKGQKFSWFDTGWICWLSGISVFALIFFIIWEMETKNPIVNLKVFKNKNFLIGTILGSMVNMLIFVTIVLLPSYLQTLMGYNALLTGFALAPRVISSVLMLLIIGTLIEKFDNRLLISLGFLLLGISTYMYTNISLTISLGAISLPNLIMGPGVILVFIPVSALVLGTLPKTELSNGAGVHSLCKCVTTAISVSLSTTLVARLSQVHQTYLVHNMSNLNIIFQQKVHLLANIFHHLPNNIALYKAKAILYNQLITMSKLMSYTDIFKIFAFVAFLLIPFSFLLDCQKK